MNSILQWCKLGHNILSSYMLCCCSVTKSCPTLYNSMDCSMPGFPVHHYLPKFARTYVHWVADAIQPSPPLFLPSPPALCLCYHQDLFERVGSSCHVSKVLEIQLQNQFYQWIVNPLWLSTLISLLSKGLSRVFSRTTVQKHQFFGIQPSLWHKSQIHTWILDKPYLWLYGALSAKWCSAF